MRRNELGCFCTEGATLLDYRLRNRGDVIVEEKVVGACSLRERVYRSASIGGVVGCVDGLQILALTGAVIPARTRHTGGAAEPGAAAGVS
jgi:hypothetical protein